MAASILVVDDETAVASSLKTVLETKGYAVVIASSAFDATAALHKDRFDLILTDLRMETENAGYDVVREARCQPYDPMVLILTAFPIAGREWRKAGAHAMVTKPVSMQQLLRTIERLVAVRRARQSKA
jgi:CheY-like chemotaxis protein